MTKYINFIRENFKNSNYPIFTLLDIKILLNKKKIGKGYLKILLNHLIKTKEIIRIRKGSYTFHKDGAYIGFSYRPFYYGMEDALEYRKLWNQNSNPIIMTPNVVKEGMRKFINLNYIVKRVKPEHFFGYDSIKYYDIWIPVSDPEKTLIDLLYYKHGIRKEVLEKLSKIINEERLEEYLTHYKKGFRIKVHEVLSKRPKIEIVL